MRHRAGCGRPSLARLPRGQAEGNRLGACPDLVKRSFDSDRELASRLAGLARQVGDMLFLYRMKILQAQAEA